MEKISDYGTYTDGMRKSMTDKTWFLNMIDGAKEIVDYGCADGALLRYIADAMPGVFNLTGIDIDEEMLKLANVNLSCNCEQNIALFTPDQFSDISANAHVSCLNCGSVIHEVYSYGTPESIEKFWDFVFNSGFQYIAIRDMAMSKIDILTSDAVMDDTLRKITNYNYGCPAAGKRFNDFLNYTNPLGSLSASEWIWRDIVHYLLKYRYVTNWDREMRENYLPLLTEEVLLTIPSNYRVKYYEHYTLPYLKDQVMKDFGIDLNTKTHYKLLLERVD